MMGGASKHFRERVLERCPAGTDPDLLADEITTAIRDERHDVIERVMRTHRPSSDAPKRTIWRVRISGESIYVIVCDRTLHPVTVMTQEQIRITKAAKKARRKRETIEGQMIGKEVHRHGRARVVRLRKQGGLWR